MTRFKLVVPSYNSYPWIERTLHSIESQLHDDYQVVVIDDASTDPKHKAVAADYCARNGWPLLAPTQNRGALAGIVDGIAAHNCEDDDVIALVDGDDWLANEWVLEKLDTIYRTEQPLYTYGQYLNYRAGTIGHCEPFPKKTVKKNRFREEAWLCSHLRTFKYDLWKRVRDADLRDPKTGEYFRTASDLAIMFPIAEMAGPRHRFIEEVLYIYNDNNPINDFRIRRAEQHQTDLLIRSFPKYTAI